MTTLEDKYRLRDLRSGKKRILKRVLFQKNSNCGICGRPLESMKTSTIDHIFPVSKGGTHAFENLQLAHQECNEHKGEFFWEPVR